MLTPRVQRMHDRHFNTIPTITSERLVLATQAYKKFAGEAITFVLVGLVCFATANIWSIPAVCTPIILPLAAATGASIPLTLGAIISAACFGAQACFYSDVTLMSASACKINNVDYAMAQLPYIGIVAGITIVGYIVAGFALAA